MRQIINLVDTKLQKYLQILQIIQQRLINVISEVKNDDSIVSLAIKSNDCIVATILWFNSLVKKSKNIKNENQSVKAEKGSSVTKNVMENIDLFGLEQQLLLDSANLFKKKQLRDLKIQKEEQLKQQQQQHRNFIEDIISEPVPISIPQQFIPQQTEIQQVTEIPSISNKSVECEVKVDGNNCQSYVYSVIFG